MIEKINSKKGELFFVICYFNNRYKEKRIELTDPKEYLQSAVIQSDEHQIYPAHYHIKNERKIDNTQEAWVIIEGKIRVKLYDEDKTLICEKELQSGDCFITLHGGHEFEALSKNVFAYEFKNGPFLGTEKDKKWIT